MVDVWTRSTEGNASSLSPEIFVVNLSHADIDSASGFSFVKWLIQAVAGNVLTG